jgi:hypothetical protein
MVDKYARIIEVGDKIRFLPWKETEWRDGTIRRIDGYNEAEVDDGAWNNPDRRSNGARIVTWVPCDRIVKVGVPAYTAEEVSALRDDNRALRDRVQALEEELAHRKAVLTIPEVYVGVVSDAVAAELEDAKARIVELMRELKEARQT